MAIKWMPCSVVMETRREISVRLSWKNHYLSLESINALAGQKKEALSLFARLGCKIRPQCNCLKLNWSWGTRKRLDRTDPNVRGARGPGQSAKSRTILTFLQAPGCRLKKEAKHRGGGTLRGSLPIAGVDRSLSPPAAALGFDVDDAAARRGRVEVGRRGPSVR
jgi:hypothetical protein